MAAQSAFTRLQTQTIEVGSDSHTAATSDS